LQLLGQICNDPVRVNDEGRYIRKPSSRPKLDAEGGDLVDALIAARLLTTWDENGIRMVEVAHEALFTAWDLLATVLREHHAFLLGLQQLARDQAEWAEAVKVGRQGDLLTGLRLARAREWFEAGRLEGAQHDFVASSIAAAEALARSAHRRRQIFLGLGIAAVLLVGAVSYFADVGRRAQTRAQAAQLVTAAMTEIEKAEIRSAAADAGQAYDLAPTNETRSLLLHLMLQVSGHLEQIHALGPIGPVQLAWSPDGKRVIAAGNKGQFVEWRIDGQSVTSLRTSNGYDPAGSRAGPLALGWDGKNHFIAISSDGKLVREDGVASTTLALPSGDRVSLASVDAAAAGILAVAKVSDGEPIVFESNGHPVPMQGNCREGVVTTGFTSAIAMAPDGSRLVLGNDEGWLCSIARISSDQPHALHTNSPVRAIAVAGTTGHIAARLEDGRIFIAGLDLSEPVLVPKDSEAPRTPLLAWSRDGSHLASPCRSHSLCIWAVEARQSDRIRVVAELEGADRIQALAWSPDGRSLASADAIGNLAVWNMQPDITAYAAPIKRGTGLTSLAATLDGARLIAGSANGDVALFEFNTRTVASFSTVTQSDDDRAIVSLAPHPTEPSLIVAAKNGWLTVRHIPDGAEQRSYDLRSMKPLTAAIWLGNGTRFAVAGASDLVLLESDSSLRDALERLPDSGDIQAMVFDENHQQLLTTGDDDRVLAWNVGSLRIVTPYQALINVDPLLRGRSVLALSPGGTQVAAAGNDGQILLYDTTTKSVVQRFKAGAQIDAAAFSANGKMLVSVRPDGYIEVWDTTNGSAAFARARLSSVPQSVIFLARQNAFAVGDNEGVIRIFGIDPNSWRSRARRLAAE
jgi:WD40 repeat protein